jgi:prefoldin subunit 4
MVGESFFQVSEDEAVEHLDKARELSQQFLTKYVDEAETIKSEMDDLKKTLYSKFGSSINLEDK